MKIIQKKKNLVFAVLILCGFLFGFSILSPVQASPELQTSATATLNIPTVTGTPSGAMVKVMPGGEEQINVRSGPDTLYPKVGVLIVGQQMPAKGRSKKGEWILIDYPGVPSGQAWVYSQYVRIDPPTDLPIVIPPPTPTPLYTPTIDPTLAAKFIITAAPTRLPTYTAPAPLSYPTFAPESNEISRPGVPAGLVVIVLVIVGALLTAVSFAQAR